MPTQITLSDMLTLIVQYAHYCNYEQQRQENAKAGNKIL